MIVCLRVLVTFQIIVVINIMRKQNPIIVLYQAHRRHVLHSTFWEIGIAMHFLQIKSVRTWGCSTNRPVYLEHRCWGIRQNTKSQYRVCQLLLVFVVLETYPQNTASVSPRSLSNFNDWKTSSSFYPPSTVQTDHVTYIRDNSLWFRRYLLVHP